MSKDYLGHDARFWHDQMLLAAGQQAEAFLRMSTALRKLVGGAVLNQDEMGGCVYCGGSGKEGSYGYCTAEPDCHAADCEWIEGRRLLGILDDVEEE